jgi:hypothetical protein
MASGVVLTLAAAAWVVSRLDECLADERNGIAEAPPVALAFTAGRRLRELVMLALLATAQDALDAVAHLPSILQAGVGRVWNRLMQALLYE